jgi:gamma-glutamyltranspeptidase/glutathione hydrolase
MKLTLKVFIFIGISLFHSNLPASPTNYAIASADPLATHAGEQILLQGGNAFDAAVAVSAALAVVEPYGSGLGGGGFWLLHDAKNNHDVVIDGREVAPLRAHRDMYLDAHGKPDDASVNGPLAAGIPGVVAALEYINNRYGKLSFKQNLQPAIKLAQQGFTPNERYLRLVKFRQDVLRESPDASKIFLIDGEIPNQDSLIKQNDLAQTLQRIAEFGAQDFYKGVTAKKLVKGVAEAGGIWTADDLDAYKIIERNVISTTFNDIEIILPPPPTSGGVVISQILAMLENKALGQLNEVDYIHTIVEAMRRGYRDRAIYLGDPAFVNMPMKQLLDKNYAREQFQSFNINKASISLNLAIDSANKGEDTTHFSVFDAQGNYVSATLSVNYPFGSGFVPPGTGVLLNDEMNDFAVAPDAPNVWGLVGYQANEIAPGKRMLSSMTPLFARTKNKVLIIGTPGGSRIISMLALALLQFNENKSAAEIVAGRRFHHQYLPDEIQFEKNALSESEMQGLRKKGHKLNEKSRQYGNMQAIIWDKDKHIIEAASDPRGHGLAVVEKQ